VQSSLEKNNPYREVFMFTRFGIAAITGALALSATTPVLAVSGSTVFQSYRAAENSASKCAQAATEADAGAGATEDGLNACAMAIKSAGAAKDQLTGSLINRSILHLARKEYDAVIADTTAALEINSNLSAALVNRGVAQILAGHPREAITDLTRSLDQSPAFPERVYFNRAMAREDAGDQAGAYVDYRRASQLAPEWDRPKQELSRFTVVPRTPTS
jgi:tetratricopeptide (TPR) repeat protein